MDPIVLKVVGGGLIVLACGGFGAYPVRKMNCRINEMELLYYCMLRLKSEICHTLEPLPLALQHAAANAGKKGSLYAKAMLLISSRLLEGREGYEAVLEQTIREVFLESVITEEETEGFQRVLLSLGGADRERQAEILTYYAEQQQEKMQEEKRRKKERGYLYRSMGVLAGVFLTVILL